MKLQKQVIVQDKINDKQMNLGGVQNNYVMTNYILYNQKNTILENSMLQAEIHDHGNLSESQIYDDLSQIIKSFKTILTYMENISASLYRYEPITSLIQELKNTMRNLNIYTKVYSTPVDNHSEHKNTFHRFICRLIESISAYKLKFQSLPYFSIISADINQIENSVISYQQQKNIGSVIKKIHIAINRFCSKMIKKSQSYTKVTQKDDLSTNQQKGSQFPSISGEYSQQDKLLNGLGLGAETRLKKVVQSKSQNTINRVMNLLNRRFKTVSCLDIEYQQFKQLFFRSRDSKEQLFEDCLQRNSFIYKQMVRYSRQFSEYLQRKQLKIFRKNKFVDSIVNQHLGHNKVKNSKQLGRNDQSHNFTKKKVGNHQPRKTSYINQHKNTNQQQNSSHTPQLMSRSEYLDDQMSNLVSIQHQDSGHLTPQLIERTKKVTTTRDKQYDQKFQEMNAETILELTKRKKNLQLKKIDISLTSFNSAGQAQSAKTKTKLLNVQVFKKTVTQNSKQMQQKLNTSIRKNYLHKKYQQAMKKNLEQSINDANQSQKIYNPSPSKYSSAKCIDVQGDQSPTNLGRQRKYLFKTSNKRNLNTGTQFISLNPSQKKQLSTIKNFRKLKVEQVEKIQRLQKMKQMALNHMEICSGGRAIRPAFIYRQKTPTQNLYTEVAEEDFSDVNLGSHKQFQMGGSFNEINK